MGLVVVLGFAKIKKLVDSYELIIACKTMKTLCRLKLFSYSSTTIH